MEASNKKNVFQISCPCCEALLWVDSLSQEVIKSEKKERRKGSLDDLLLKEKKRKEEFERKFEATAELEREKKKKTQEKFEKALSKLGKEE